MIIPWQYWIIKSKWTKACLLHKLIFVVECEQYLFVCQNRTFTEQAKTLKESWLTETEQTDPLSQDNNSGYGTDDYMVRSLASCSVKLMKLNPFNSRKICFPKYFGLNLDFQCLFRAATVTMMILKKLGGWMFLGCSIWGKLSIQAYPN